MEGFFILLGLLLLAIPIIAIVALVKSIGAGEHLRRIELRLAVLQPNRIAHLAEEGAGMVSDVLKQEEPDLSLEDVLPRNPCVLEGPCGDPSGWTTAAPRAT